MELEPAGDGNFMAVQLRGARSSAAFPEQGGQVQGRVLHFFAFITKF